MRRKKFWLPVIVSLAITPFCLLFAAISGGVGHGDYTPAIILFPYAALLASALDPLFDSTPLMIAVALMQYPSYGVLLGRYAEKNRLAASAICLVVLHIVLAGAAYLVAHR
jgi:hypothetical protein